MTDIPYTRQGLMTPTSGTSRRYVAWRRLSARFGYWRSIMARPAGADIDKTFYIALTSKEYHHMAEHNIINSDCHHCYQLAPVSTTTSSTSNSTGRSQLHQHQECSAHHIRHRPHLPHGVMVIKLHSVKRLIQQNIVSFVGFCTHQLLEKENHQHRINIGALGHIQVVFKWTSPSQLHQQTTSGDYCCDI